LLLTIAPPCTVKALCGRLTVSSPIFSSTLAGVDPAAGTSLLMVPMVAPVESFTLAPTWKLLEAVELTAPVAAVSELLLAAELELGLAAGVLVAVPVSVSVAERGLGVAFGGVSAESVPAPVAERGLGVARGASAPGVVVLPGAVAAGPAPGGVAAGAPLVELDACAKAAPAARTAIAAPVNSADFMELSRVCDPADRLNQQRRPRFRLPLAKA
jgi:hypothetical protein